MGKGLQQSEDRTEVEEHSTIEYVYQLDLHTRSLFLPLLVGQSAKISAQLLRAFIEADTTIRALPLEELAAFFPRRYCARVMARDSYDDVSSRSFNILDSIAGPVSASPSWPSTARESKARSKNC